MEKANYFFVSLFAAFAFGASGVAQDQVVTFTTAKAVGETMTLVTNKVSNGVTVDWGDGTPVAYTTDTISAPVKGSTVTLTGNEKLVFICCSDNGLTAVDISKAPQLQSFSCANNQLTELNTSSNTELTDLNCSNNQISALTITSNQKLQNLLAANNQLTRFIGIPSLLSVDVSGNQLTSLSMTSSRSIDYLNFGENDVKTLAFTAPDITTVCGDANQLTSFSISGGMNNLVDVSVADNQLNTLNLRTAVGVKGVYCANNQLNRIILAEELRQARCLDVYDCRNNRLGFNSLLPNSALPDYFMYMPQGTIDLSDELETSTSPWKPAYMLVSDAADEGVKSVDLDDYRRDVWGNNICFMRIYKVENGERTLLTANTDYRDAGGVISFLKPFDSVVCQFEPSASPYRTDGFISSTEPFAVYASVADNINDAVAAGDGLQISVGDGVLSLSASKTTAVKVFNVSGQPVWQGTVGTATTQVKLEKGVYVVNGKTVRL